MIPENFIYHYQEEEKEEKNLAYAVIYDSGEYCNSYTSVIGICSNLRNASLLLTGRIEPQLIKSLSALDQSNFHDCNPFDVIEKYFVQIFEIDQYNKESTILQLSKDIFSKESGFPNFLNIRDDSYNAESEIKWVSNSLENLILAELERYLVT